MYYSVKMFAVLLFVFIVQKNIVANTEPSTLDKNEEYNTMVTMALFDKINWIIQEIGSIHQVDHDINTTLQEYKSRLNLHATKLEMKELLKQQNIKTESLLLQLQQEVMKNLEIQKDLWKTTSLTVESFKSLDVTSFKRTRNWQTILRREDGSENFNRSWNEYKMGFGQENGDFFIGLEKLHAMTTYGSPQELLIVLKDFNNQTRYAKYGNFVIASEKDKYQIKEIGKYQGDAGDSFTQHLHWNFSTYDQDNDRAITSCAKYYAGGWWFSRCYFSHLTGIYLYQPQVGDPRNRGVTWDAWHGTNYSLKYAEMMIRPK